MDTQMKEIKKAEKRINSLQYKLMNLGFTSRAPSDLKQIIENTYSQYEKRLAARLLALWYSGLRSEEGARKCLEILPLALDGENDSEIRWKTAIMEAECLEVLKNTDQAKMVISRELATHESANLYLAAANLEASIFKRIEWINKALALHKLSPIACKPSKEIDAFDCLQPDYSQANMPKIKMDETTPKVSVILPVYNAQRIIKTALNSLLSQTWGNLEILVVDDGSDDATSEIVESFCKHDSRIYLMVNRENKGPYVARNTALSLATGDLVCCHDADDWSHPQMIEKQVLHLMQNTDVMANTSQQARLSPELKFHRRYRYGYYVLNNLPSFMFRRKPIMEALGYWDSVRFSADSELMRRIRKVFGKNTVVNLHTGPLCFQRQHESSLTGNKYFGAEYYYFGARKEYYEAQLYHHKHAPSLNYEFPQFERPFPVPEPMWPIREINNSKKRHFDIVYAADFRVSDCNTRSIEEEIKAQKDKGLRTGLIQMARYHVKPQKHIAPLIRELIDGDKVQVLVYGEEITCELLIIYGPTVLQEWQKYIPRIDAEQIHVIADKPPAIPKDNLKKPVKKGYILNHCQQQLQDYFSNNGIWHPISPLIRKALLKKTEDFNPASLSDKDWLPVIDVNRWQRNPTAWRGEKIIIGRYSQNQKNKWPADPETLLKVYPEDEQYEIHILGGVKVPRRILGDKLPANWHVFKSGKILPEDFLANLDIFVYYPHPQKAFTTGRAILEAMASGVPVICPPLFYELFGNAPIYAEPSEVKMYIDWLANNRSAYEARAARAKQFVQEHFNPQKHLSRLHYLQKGNY